MLNKNIDLKNGSFSFSDYFKINIKFYNQELGTTQEQNYQYDAGILFLVGFSHEEHSYSM